MSGTELSHVLAMHGGNITRFARIPTGTHNAQPFRGGIIANHTKGNQIAYMNRKGRIQRFFPIITYDHAELTHSSLPSDHARPSFGRGLCIWRNRFVIAGSSPATVSAIDFDTGERLAS